MNAPSASFPVPRPRASADHGRARDAMLRVDQAGEYGAVRIYAGQLAVLGDRHPAARAISAMAAQEAVHLERFNAMMAQRGVRPTLLQPLWHVAGFALGAATALIGPEAAMACTAAIETEIDKHYQEQREELADHQEADAELVSTIEQFQAEEVEHRDAALAAGAERAPAYPVLAGLIRLGCRTAITLSKRL